MSVVGLTERTKSFAVRIVRSYARLPKRSAATVIGRQMLRSGTSVGAHCREAFRRRSDAELVSKLQVAIQELDETLYWMELIVEAEILDRRILAPLMQEANELLAITVSSVRTIRKRQKSRDSAAPHN